MIGVWHQTLWSQKFRRSLTLSHPPSTHISERFELHVGDVNIWLSWGEQQQGRWESSTTGRCWENISCPVNVNCSRYKSRSLTSRRTERQTHWHLWTVSETYWLWLGGEAQVVLIKLFFLFPWSSAVPIGRRGNFELFDLTGHHLHRVQTHLHHREPPHPPLPLSSLLYLW